jgi:hypothetical protein
MNKTAAPIHLNSPPKAASPNMQREQSELPTLPRLAAAYLAATCENYDEHHDQNRPKKAQLKIAEGTRSPGDLVWILHAMDRSKSPASTSLNTVACHGRRGGFGWRKLDE